MLSRALIPLTLYGGYKASTYYYNQPLAMADDSAVNDDLLYPEFQTEIDELPEYKKNKYNHLLRKRDDHIKELTKKDLQFDMLIVGGGANGAGVLLEGASRGMKCALIDSHDFGGATSCRSTKLAHGGIRYLE